MVRGRGYSPDHGSHNSSYHGSSGRPSSSWTGNTSRGSYRSPSGKLSNYSSHDSKNKYGSRYEGSSSSRGRLHVTDRHKTYKQLRTPSYPARHDDRRSGLKRPRMEASSSRRDSGYGKKRPLPPPPPPLHSSSRMDDRRYARDRRPTSSTSLSRREHFPRPLAPGPASRMAGKGRIGSNSSRSLNPRDRRAGGGRQRQRLADNSYQIKRRRAAMQHAAEFNRKLKLARMRRTVIRRRIIGRKPEDKETSTRDKSKEKRDRASKEGTEDKSKNSEKTETKKSDGNKSSKSEDEDDKSKKKSLIELTCPHCNFRAVTFRRYDIHLTSHRHLTAMKNVAQKQKSILSQMRLAQRNAQNELEKELEKNDDTDLTEKTSFCPLCKLNYKQKKSVHQETGAHKNMKKFLMPHCKYCNISFKSPMTYESHCCSIRHIKQKQRVENASDCSEEEVDLENFTTIDSIGEEASDNEDTKEPTVNVGIEQIQKIEVYRCNLCKVNLPRGDEKDAPKILAKHCKNREHMKRYIRFKEDKDLERRAEELHLKELAEKEIKKEEIVKGTVNNDKNDDDDNIDEKVLGDILMKAGDKSSDDEDDSHINGERYDRFKLSEKNGDEQVKTEEEDTKVNGTEEEKN